MTTKHGPETDVQIYQLKVTLEGIKPPVWRRLLVPGDDTLGDLHDIIQVAFGWLDYHLHQFIVGDAFYGVPDPDYLDYVDMRDEEHVTLSEILAGEGFRFRYEYDFGDGWMHLIEVEKVLAPEPDQLYPVCIKGRRARPPEDVGGIWGYQNFLEAIRDPEHDEHESYLEWIGGEFDPEAFDLDEVNQALEALAWGELRVQVIHGPQGDELRAMHPIDRGVAVIVPRQPLVDWVNRTVASDEPISLHDLEHDRTAILVPDLESLDAVLEYLEPIKPLLFEIELEGWAVDPGDWPPERTAELFDAWFDIQVHSMVWDVVALPVPGQQQ
ncbi:MAG TPA: plasmid pRiA4b ORF-3 family protein [Anaerolineae bacterium]|nr:plasmid pRiA4b ORF-3 family protein [Anaerolineae bacterium]